MKRIVFLHPAHFEQSMGGAEYQIALLIRFLRREYPNLEIFHIFEDSTSPIKNELNIQLVPLKKVRLSKRFGNRWFLYRKKIEKQLNAIAPDVIYTRFFSSWSGIAAEYAKSNNCVHVWALASDSDVTRIQSKVRFTKPLDHIENKWVTRAFKNAAFIVTQNNYQQEQLKKIVGRDGVLIKQSGNISPSEMIAKSETIVHICWIANLKPIKQPELFIELCQRFKNNSSVDFTMIGRPHEDYTQLIQEISAGSVNFHYLGELSNDEVNDVLCRSHILVNTSEYEGFSNTFIQAWMRKVVVMSLNSDPDELLTKRKIGYLSETVDEMEQLIAGLIDNPKEISEMGQKAFEYVCENHSYEKNITPLIKLMKIDE